MSVYGELDAALREDAEDNEEYQRWKEQVCLHFEGHLFYWEIDEGARKVLSNWEDNVNTSIKERIKHA